MVSGAAGRRDAYMLTSIVDICITTPMKALERVCLLAKALAERA